MKNLQDIIKKEDMASVYRMMSFDDGPKRAQDMFVNWSDSDLNMMASSLHGISEEHKPIFRSLIRGEGEQFKQLFSAFKNQLEIGDLILMTGVSRKSKILVNSQKPIYANARSSHIAIVQTDVICIDAIPKRGVANSLISEILSNVENDWRVIRFNQMNDAHRKDMPKMCAFYLQQPYKILPSKKPAKKFSYCSELARKVYYDSKVQNCRIPKNSIIKPCDFDRIADHNNDWSDVTIAVKPFIDFCKEYEDILKVVSKPLIDGLRLNQSRFEDRRKWKRDIKSAEKKKHISTEKASELITQIRENEKKLHSIFWDSDI